MQWGAQLHVVASIQEGGSSLLPLPILILQGKFSCVNIKGLYRLQRKTLAFGKIISMNHC